MSSLTVTTIQTDPVWEDKAANLGLLEDQIDLLPEGAELVVVPEMFSTGFSMRPEMLAEGMDGPTVSWMRDITARKKIILTGSIIIGEAGQYFNRLIWMQPNGQYGYYDKRHCFAYAGENEHYSPGGKRLITSVKGWKVLPLVCYDLRFPVWSRQMPEHTLHTFPTSSLSDRQRRPPSDQSRPSDLGAHPTSEEPEYDLLIYVANWPDRRIHAWKTLLQARAIENQAYVIGVNRVGDDGNDIHYSGDSMIIDPLGEVLYHGPDREETFTHTFRKETLKDIRVRFPFLRDADHFSIEP
jgi:omega-amidase